MILLAGFSFGQQDDLYDHGLDENKWNELRDGIRYENQPDGAGREWTYESKRDYETAKKNRKNSGGSGDERSDGSNGDAGRMRDRELKERESYQEPETPKMDLDFSGLGPIGYILLGIFILLIAFLIYYLFVNRVKDGKTVSAINLEETAPTEIPLTELQRMLQEALARADYRGAVRIYFIFIVRDLSQKNWINWEKEKTNFHYLREMSSRSEYNDFNKSVSYFEIIWYGKREIDKSTFDQIKPDFTNFLDKLGVK
ncbi:MAG: hypothetical protein IPH24_10330 [Crocinitomicaceae bacterium]|nr:hypothetical protein [Crocinitomicaceae bacterium]